MKKNTQLSRLLAKLLAVSSIFAATLQTHQLAAEDAAPKAGFGDVPNFIFVFADDINADFLGVYGSPDVKTPNIDKLAADGIKFNHAYCTTAMCSPFRVELYSGRTSFRTLVMANHMGPKPGTPGVTSHLSPKNYLSKVHGKGHGVGSFRWDDVEGSYGNKAARGKAYKEMLDTADPSIANMHEFAQGVFFKIREAKRENRPLLHYVASVDGHTPHVTGDPSQYPADKLSMPEYWVDTPETRAFLPKYYAEVTHFDQVVGQIRKVLELEGVAENTLLMVSTEQGSTLPFAKWTNYINGVRTALIGYWPGVIPPGTVSDALVSVSDIVPTFADAAGIELEPGAVDGKSLMPILRGDDDHVNHEYVFNAFSNLHMAQARDRVFPIRTIRNQEFSLFFNPNFEDGYTNNYTNAIGKAILKDGEPIEERKGKGGYSIVGSWFKKYEGNFDAQPLLAKLNFRPQFEFYDLRKDPNELNNQIDNPEYAAVIAKMKKELYAHMQKWDDADPIETDRRIAAQKIAASAKQDARNQAAWEALSPEEQQRRLDKKAAAKARKKEANRKKQAKQRAQREAANGGA